VPKIGPSNQLHINCYKIRQSSFISTNRAGKYIERCINIPH
jgi:hypothetical protein